MEPLTTDPQYESLAVPKVVIEDMPYRKVSSSRPLRLDDPSALDFKLTEDQLEYATDMIHNEIQKVFKAMKPGKKIDDPRYLQKLDKTMQIAKEFESLPDGEKYIVVYNALKDYYLMLQIAQELEVRDIYEKDGLREVVTSTEFFEFLADIVREKTPKLFSLVGDEESEFIDISNRKRITMAVQANGVKRKNPRPTAGQRQRVKLMGTPGLAPVHTMGLAPVHTMGLAPYHRAKLAPINMARRRRR